MKNNNSAKSVSLSRQFLAVALLSTIPLFLLIVLSNLAFLFGSRRMLEIQVENATTALHGTIEIQLENSIRAYLRSKVEMAMNLLDDALESGEDLEKVINTLKTIEIGKSGYFYGLDSQGVIVFHIDPELIGTSLADLPLGKAQLSQKYGYYEYDWQNPMETTSHSKALYMEYNEKLDWIITATSYREEFAYMVDRDAILRIVQNSTVGYSGYSYVFDNSGEVVAHPFFSTKEEIDAAVGSEEYKELINQFFSQKEGFSGYKWLNYEKEVDRSKMVYLKYLPDFDWIVGTAVFQSEINRPILILVIIDLTVAAVMGLFLTRYIFRVNKAVTTQIERISDGLELGRMGNLGVRIEESGPKELRTITGNVNFFIENLETRTRELEDLNTSLEDRVRMRTQELAVASQRLVESEKQALTSRLVAGVAHEINTPVGIALTSVTFAGECLTSLGREESLDTSEEEAGDSFNVIQEAIEIAEKNLKRAGGLIQSFKNVSSDQLSLNKRTFHLPEVVDDIIVSMKSMVRKQNVDISVDIPDIVLDSYPGVFTHVLGNLINNSLKHGFVDERKGEIRISAKQDGEKIIFEYRDNGIGISKNLEGSIFDPFITSQRNAGSIGLGMNIVKNLVVEKLKGTIDVESSPGEYTRFIIEFPYVSG